LKDKRSVFTPGSRYRMNIVAMFLNAFLPWAVFILCYGVVSFRVMYHRPLVAFAVILAFIVFWLLLTREAIRVRRQDVHCSWYSYASLMVGVAVFFGTYLGYQNYRNNSRHLYEIQDLKVIGHIDADKEFGQNVMDAGIFYFADNNHIDPTKSWHFKHGTVYCVAPIIGVNPTPETASFDYWAVGKDCCSTSSSDFRCGDFRNPKARSGVRILNDADRPFYRLAVEQSETLYNIKSTYPVFVEWTQDPLGEMNVWGVKAYNAYMSSVATFFVISSIGVLVATVRFSFLGRRGAEHEQFTQSV